MVTAGAVALGQGQEPQQPRFRSSVSTVSLYATVNDAEGRLVPDLLREDFRVFDDGVERPIALFSNETQPITVVVMLDMSASMIGRFLMVKSSTQGFIKALHAGDRAQIGSFGEEIAISPLLTGDKSVLNRVLRDELWPMGGTPLWNAVDAGMTALAAESGRRVVLALTDGHDTCVAYPRCLNAGDVERRATREGFMVYGIGMEGTGLDASMKRLTEETGGGSFELTAGANLTSTFERVAEELRRQYLIGFTPNTLDGKMHKVEVRAIRKGMKVRARKSYLSEKS
jgi:Ca-activated chloride channel family protein